jgi:hypothetical protein
LRLLIEGRGKAGQAGQITATNPQIPNRQVQFALKLIW